MLGFLTWMLTGLAAFAVSRMVRQGRLSAWLELPLAVIGSFMAGLGATALDFGGWAEVDPRAITFGVLVTFAVLGAARTVGLVLARR